MNRETTAKVLVVGGRRCKLQIVYRIGAAVSGKEQCWQEFWELVGPELYRLDVSQAPTIRTRGETSAA